MSGSDGTQRPVKISNIPVQDKSNPPPRKELREVKKNPKEWTLLLLGMELFQSQPENHPLSYYQICGIHGRPYERWPKQGWDKGEDNKVDLKKVVQRGGEPVKQWGGYCTHSSILFVPWHRPYLALFEQALYMHVNTIANMYEEDEGKNEYVKLAQNFRLPYWDWALPTDRDKIFPAEFLISTKHEGKFNRPRNQKKVGNEFVDNPLGCYRFSKSGPSAEDKVTKGGFDTTVRWPNKTDLADYYFQDPRTKAGAEWAGKGKNLTERTMFLLQAYESFGAMSNNSFRRKEDKFSNYGSLEDTHNTIHDIVGGNGHMSDAGVAAFDPIFWFHHCNIDRLWALWQALHDDSQNPNAGVTKQPANEGTFTTDMEASEDENTELTPFAKSEQLKGGKPDYWTYVGTRDTRTFGYVYPETDRSKYPKKGQVVEALRTNYKLGTLSGLKDPEADIGGLEQRAKFQRKVAALKSVNTEAMIHEGLHEATTPILMDKQAISQVEIPKARSVHDLFSSDNKYLEWLVDIKAEKYALNGKFQVHIFLGAPNDENPKLYLADPGHVSFFTPFGNGPDTECEKCREGQAAELQITSQIPLTMALVERYLAGVIDSLQPGHVVKYLKANLHWRVTNLNSERLGRADVGNLLVAVVSNEVTVSDDPQQLPVYAPNVVPYPEATTRENGEGRGKGTGYTGDNFVAPAGA